MLRQHRIPPIFFRSLLWLRSSSSSGSGSIVEFMRAPRADGTVHAVEYTLPLGSCSVIILV